MALFGHDIAPGTTSLERSTNRLVGAALVWEAIKLLRMTAEQSMQLNGFFKGVGKK